MLCCPKSFHTTFSNAEKWAKFRVDNAISLLFVRAKWVGGHLETPWVNQQQRYQSAPLNHDCLPFQFVLNARKRDVTLDEYMKLLMNGKHVISSPLLCSTTAKWNIWAPRRILLFNSVPALSAAFRWRDNINWSNQWKPLRERKTLSHSQPSKADFASQFRKFTHASIRTFLNSCLVCALKAIYMSSMDFQEYCCRLERGKKWWRWVIYT